MIAIIVIIIIWPRASLAERSLFGADFYEDTLITARPCRRACPFCNHSKASISSLSFITSVHLLSADVRRAVRTSSRNAPRFFPGSIAGPQKTRPLVKGRSISRSYLYRQDISSNQRALPSRSFNFQIRRYLRRVRAFRIAGF